MQISFITDFSAQTMNVNTYLSEQNPVLVPVGSTDAGFAFANTMKTTMETKYGRSKVSALSDINNIVIADFDKKFIFPKKLS